jgi:hypothetical protein
MHRLVSACPFDATRMHAMTKKTKASEPGSNWVPLIEGARMMVRLGGHAPPWSKEVCDEATAKLLEALRLSHIASRGHSEVSERRERISAKDWQSLCADIAKNRLVPRIPSGRRYPRDGFFDVEVSTTDIQRIFSPEVSETKSSVPAAMKGRPPKYDWQDIKTEAMRLMDYHDDFMPSDPQWNSPTKLIENLLMYCLKRYGKQPAISTMKAKVKNWLPKWRESKSGY